VRAPAAAPPAAVGLQGSWFIPGPGALFEIARRDGKYLKKNNNFPVR
jgi:hypothetical protein